MVINMQEQQTQPEVKEETASEAAAPAPTVEEPAPEVQAVMFLHSALPRFRAQLQKVTGVQGKRVLEALIESPLEQKVPGFTTKEAHDLFMLGTMIQNAKFVLFQVSLKDEKIVEEVQQQAVAEAQAEAPATEEVKEGESQ
jgi:hypothetical protein